MLLPISMDKQRIGLNPKYQYIWKISATPISKRFLRIGKFSKKKFAEFSVSPTKTELQNNKFRKYNK